MSKAKYNMTEGKEWKLILLFSIPLLIGNLVQQTYNVVDGIIVGNIVGEAAFASVMTSQPLVQIYLALSIGLSVGVGVVSAQYFGAGKKRELPVAINTALILLGACGLLLTIVGVTLSPLMLRAILNVPEELLPEASLYMRIFSIGLVFQFLYNCIASILRGFGNSKATLYFLIISAVLNVVLTTLLVVVFELGVAGAALATVISQSVSAMISYWYLRKHFPAEKSEKYWDTEMAMTMIRLGFPIALQMSIISFGNGAMQRLVNSFAVQTPAVVPAYGAATRVDAILFAPIAAFQAGVANFTGQNIGAGNLKRVRNGLRSGIIMSVSCTVAICVVYYIFADTVIGFFGLTDASIRIGAEMARYLALFFWIISINCMFSGMLQGAGDTLIISMASLAALLVRVTGGYTMAHFGIMGYSAAWIPVPIGWICWSCVIYTRYFSGKWKEKALVGREVLKDES